MDTDQMGWNFDNSYLKLPDIFYSTPRPAPAAEPKLIFLNRALASSLGVSIDSLLSDAGVQELAGNELPENGAHFAQAYAGHQFGVFTKLGDGRAIMIGEHITPEQERVDIQLKGAGRTLYSRGGDGLAALGPILREYIISEAMYHLGVPTTRGLAVVKTEDSVFRMNESPRGILTRVASSHLRVGTFQYAAAAGGVDAIRELADYAIDRHYPHCLEQTSPYLCLLEEVMKKQASLIAKWQLAGFIHGVMNTDNMTISGETIDYGPCAFINVFDTDTVFSSIDTEGRYKYGNQPAMANWNLARFAETLLPLIDTDEETAVKKAENSIGGFFPLFNKIWLDGMRAKLGFFTEEKKDESLIAELLDAMQKYQADYTDTFIALTKNSFHQTALFQSEEFSNWYSKWLQRINKEKMPKHKVNELMHQHNPALIPKNHLVEDALKAAVEKDDYTKISQLLEALSNPYAHNSKQAAYAAIPVPDEPFQTFCGT